MLTGLEILLDRMKTNPEEFLKDDHVPYEGESFGGKWSDLVNYAWRIATEEERQMLEDARREFYRDDFNERVMKRLAGEEVKQEQPSPYIVKQASWNDPRAALQNSVLGSGLGAQGVIQGGQYDPNIHGHLTTTGGFQAAEIKQEGMRISSGGTGFWGGISKSLGGR